MSNRVGYVEPGAANQFLRTTEVAPNEHVQHVVVASAPQVTLAIGEPTLAVVPPATVAIATMAIPTLFALTPATFSIAALPTVAIGVAPVSTTPVVGSLDRKFAPNATTVARQIVGSGMATVAAPATGKRLRLHWLGMSSSQDNSAEVLAVAKFGASGTENYRWNMGNPGAFSRWGIVEGPTDTALILALNKASIPVETNVVYEEI